MTNDTVLASERSARIAAEKALADAERDIEKLQRRLREGHDAEIVRSSAISDNRIWRWLDTLGDGFAGFDSSHRLVAANATYQRLLATAGSVGIGSRYEDIADALLNLNIVDIEGTDPEDWRQMIAERWQKPRIPDITIRLRNGKYIKIADRRTPQGDIVSLAVDVTKLMQIWAGVEAIPDGFVIYDRDERLVLCNQRYKEIYNESAAAITPGSSFREILEHGLRRGQYADAVGCEDEWLDKRLAEHRRASNIVEQKLTDGRWLRILEKSTPDGGRVGLRVDISEQKAQQAALEEARVQAEAANRAKSAFLANMSHELRTPMNGVMGMADILCETKLTDEQRLYAETIRNSGESLLSLLNDVLDLSKIEAEKLSLRPEPFDLEKTIHEVVMLMRGNAIRKGLELYIDYDMFQPTVFTGDRGRIRQILTNLIGNAVKFTDRGHVLIRVVGFEADTPGHQQIHITVEDTGIGIASDMQAHVFGEFNQVEDVETRRFQGTGLGLSITKKLVSMMDGEIWLDSEKGKGSCFGIRLTLPIAKESQKTPALRDFSGSSLLVVDDQEVNLTILERQLAPSGAKVACRKSAAEALADLHSGKVFDLVITDNLMPDTDGLELAQQIRNDLPELPILMLTSDPSILRQPNAQINIDAILQKPTLRVKLHDAVATLLHPSEDTEQKQIQDSADTDATPMRILAAEDNRTNRLVFEKLLKDLNVELTFVENGQQAVDAFQERTPDIIFMDVSMPGMDGKTATRIIREMEQSRNAPSTPVIALTAHALPGDDVALLAAGMNAYLTKPLRKQDVIQTLRTYGPKKRATLIQNSSAYATAAADRKNTG